MEALRAFVAVCESGSFSGAAADLHLTQPAVSKRIAQLEQRLDTRLFDRIGRTTTLTPSGQALYPRATSILADLGDTLLEIRNIAGNVSGELNIATNHHIGVWRLPVHLARFTRSFPKVSLSLHFMDSEVAYNQVAEGLVELAVVTLAPENDDMISAYPLWQDELTVLCSHDHPLVTMSHLEPTDLSRFPAVLPDLSTFTGRIVHQLFQNQGLDLQTSVTTNYLESIRKLVSTGLGWSVLPASMLDGSVQALAVHGLNVSRTLGVIHHRRRSLSNAASAFARSLDQ